MPKTELHTQLEAWENEVERAWEEVTQVKKELLRVAGELRQTQRTHKSLDKHAQALELVCSLNFKEGKTARLERDKLRDELKTQNLEKRGAIVRTSVRPRARVQGKRRQGRAQGTYKVRCSRGRRS